MNQTIINGLTEIKDKYDLDDIYRINTYDKVIKCIKSHPYTLKTMSEVLYVLRKNGFYYTGQEHFYRKHNMWKSSVLNNIDELLCLQNFEITHLSESNGKHTYLEFAYSVILSGFLLYMVSEFSSQIIWNWM